MKPLLNPLTEAKIHELSRRLGEHRKQYGSGCHPPREIWDKAIALCEQAPLSQVALGIGVSPNGLRNKKKERELRPPQFLEVRGLEPAASPQSSTRSHPALLRDAHLARQVELRRCDGSSLRITDCGAHGLDLRALIQGFIASAPSPRGGVLA